MSSYEREAEAALFREYRDIAGQFRYAVETERRFYLANEVEVAELNTERGLAFNVFLTDAWVWDVYRPDRFVKFAKIFTFRDVNIEELNTREVSLPEDFSFDS